MTAFTSFKSARRQESGSETVFPNRSRHAGFSLIIRMSLRTHGRELFPSHCSTGSNNRDEEKTVLKELVPMLACLNSSGAGVSLF
jgi:hypothetical protein